MKTAKKALALLLAVLMCASLFTTMAFADSETGNFPSREPTKVKILSIGTDVDGPNQYPYLAAAKLQKLFGSSINVLLQTLDQGDDTFMTASLLRTILTEGAYYEDSSNYNKAMVNEYFKVPEGGNVTPDQYADTQSKFVNAMRGDAYQYLFGVKDPDAGLAIRDTSSTIITLDLVNASLTPYLMARLTAMMQADPMGDTPFFRPDTPSKVHDQAVTGSGDMLELLLENLYTEAFISVPEEYQYFVKSICNAVSYAAFNFYADFKQDIEYIKWVNPLAKLVIVGGYNDLEGLSIKLDEDVAIDFGSFWGGVISIINSVICNDEFSASYQFADITTNRYVPTRYGTILNLAKEAKQFEKDVNANLPEGQLAHFEPVVKENMDPVLAAAIKGLLSEYEKGYGKAELAVAAEIMTPEQFAAQFPVTPDVAKDNLLQAFADAGKNNKIDVKALSMLKMDEEGMAGLMMPLIMYNSPEKYDADGKNPELDDMTAAALNLYARFMLDGGIGLQPSNKAQAEIGEAVFQAIWEFENASMKGEDVTLTIFDNIFGGILNTFRTPILDTINQVFNNMIHGVANWFSNFFANLKDGIFNFGK